MYQIGDIVTISKEIDNSNYDRYRGMDLEIINVYVGEDEHILYDESIYPMPLYELEGCDYLLYEYELEG